MITNAIHKLDQRRIRENWDLLWRRAAKIEHAESEKDAFPRRGDKGE